MTRPSAGRPDGRPRQKSVDRSGRSMCTNVHRQFSWRAGRPTRSTARELCSLYPGLGRPRGRPMAQRSEIQPLTGDRVVDRQQEFSAVLAQRLVFGLGYKSPSLWAVLKRISRAHFLIFLSVLATSF